MKVSGPGVSWTSPAELVDGGEDLVTVGDADGDGRVDLITHCSSRGGPPSNYAFIPWEGAGFAWSKRKLLPLLEGKNGDFEFVALSPSKGRYLNIVRVLSPGNILANVYSIESSDLQQGQVEVLWEGHSFVPQKWPIPLHRVAENDKMPECLWRALKEADLQKYTAKQLTLIRNEIFARHGRPFQNKTLHDYFAAQKWYQANPDYLDSFLSPLELENARFIADYQRRHQKTW